MINNLPSISNLIKKYNLTPNKKLGQNFLLNTDITDKIVKYAGDLKDINVLEIGPGVGTLTRSLLASDARHVYAIEMDSKCIQVLKDTLIPHCQDRLTTINTNALGFQEKDIAQTPLKIVANLPYNIGTELLIKWLHDIKSFLSITVMLQKEVVNRIIAAPTTEYYGRLSIICQVLCEVEKNFDIEPDCFFPPPKVVSSVVTLKPRQSPLYNCNLSSLEKITQQLFSKRRKMVRSILKNHHDNLELLLANLGIDPMARPENLTIKNICDLAYSLFTKNYPMEN